MCRPYMREMMREHTDEWDCSAYLQCYGRVLMNEPRVWQLLESPCSSILYDLQHNHMQHIDLELKYTHQTISTDLTLFPRSSDLSLSRILLLLFLYFIYVDQVREKNTAGISLGIRCDFVGIVCVNYFISELMKNNGSISINEALISLALNLIF